MTRGGPGDMSAAKKEAAGQKCRAAVVREETRQGRITTLDLFAAFTRGKTAREMECPIPLQISHRL